MEENKEQQKHFTRPGFIAAAIVIALIVVLGFGIVIGNMTRGANPEPTPTNDAANPSPTTDAANPSPTTSATISEPTSTAASASICNLKGEVLGKARLTSAPAATWDYQGTTAYPTSAEFGPAATDKAANYRYCFQHSPEGALFAAANAVIQGSDSKISSAWIKYFLSTETRNRAELLAGISKGSPATTRMKISGFRLLEYGGRNARIDIAVQVTGSGNTVFASAVYELVWEDGDWKLLPQDVSNPLRFAQIPNISGYIIWNG